QAKLLGVPFLALVTDQPEQRANLRFFTDDAGAALAAVDLAAPGRLDERLREAAGRLVCAAPPAMDRPSPAARVAVVHGRWTAALTELLAGAQARALARPHRPSVHHHPNPNEA